MRKIADEAYAVVRGTLITLNYNDTSDLSSALLEIIHVVEARTDLKINFQARGVPGVFLAERQRQLLYIFREILSNIEKHAEAKAVEVVLDWTDLGVTLGVTDDGIGFEMQDIHKPGHFGMEIIQDRVQGIDGSLEIASQPGFGTRVVVTVPLLGMVSANRFEANLPLGNYT